MSGIAPLGVGVVGCGIIAKRYVTDAPAFAGWRPVACTDIDGEAAAAFALEHGLRAESFDELLADPEVDLVLSLTPPKVHASVALAAFAAGKHVYTEKPLGATLTEGRELVAEAERLGLRLGCAPDTFLGSAYESALALIEDGGVGTPLGAAATMLVGGPDAWHPNADMFYVAGGGPLLDIAPYYLTALVSLLGPVAAVASFAGTPTPERVIGAGPRAGERVEVEVPTHAAAVLQHERGAISTLAVSFEASGQYLSGLEVYGSEGSLRLPDANAFGGDVVLRRRGEDEIVAVESLGDREARGLGIDELAAALRDGRPHRASGALALHVLETADAIVRAANERTTIPV